MCSAATSSKSSASESAAWASTWTPRSASHTSSAAVAFLADELDLRPGRAALDLGAGTGKLTRLLVATGADVVAVEPIEEMRSQLARAVPGAKPVTLPREGLVARAATVSFVAASPDEERERLLEEARAILAGEPDPVEAAYRTSVYVSRRR